MQPPQYMRMQYQSQWCQAGASSETGGAGNEAFDSAAPWHFLQRAPAGLDESSSEGSTKDRIHLRRGHQARIARPDIFKAANVQRKKSRERLANIRSGTPIALVYRLQSMKSRPTGSSPSGASERENFIRIVLEAASCMADSEACPGARGVPAGGRRRDGNLTGVGQIGAPYVARRSERQRGRSP